MHATIKIQMDNAAFEESWQHELALILRDLAKHIESGDESRRLMDGNGNHVGDFKLTQ